MLSLERIKVINQAVETAQEQLQNAKIDLLAEFCVLYRNPENISSFNILDLREAKWFHCENWLYVFEDNDLVSRIYMKAAYTFPEQKVRGDILEEHAILSKDKETLLIEQNIEHNEWSIENNFIILSAKNEILCKEEILWLLEKAQDLVKTFCFYPDWAYTIEEDIEKINVDTPTGLILREFEENIQTSKFLIKPSGNIQQQKTITPEPTKGFGNEPESMKNEFGIDENGNVPF